MDGLDVDCSEDFNENERRFERLAERVAYFCAGLAPLELVLSLPLLLMIMAMMIIVGTAGSWKVRTLANSRQAAARSIWPRTGDNDPKPGSWWPNSATMSFGSASPSPLPNDPFQRHYVVRGPTIASPAGSSLPVDDTRLDATRGLHAGRASIDRDLPLWKTLPYRNRYDRDTQVFSDHQWQHGTMGQGTTWQRRIPVIYPSYDLGRYGAGSVGEMQSTLMNLMALYNTDPHLPILDRDDELRSFYGNPYNNQWGARYDRFNFHPAAGGCTTDLQPIVDRLVGRPAQPPQPAIVGEIHQVPCRITREFWRMYVDQLSLLNCDDPGRGALITSVRQLENFSDQLECPLGPWQDPCSNP